MRAMRLSIWPSLQQPWSDVVEVLAHAEATGWDGAYLADHFMGDGSGVAPVGTPTLEATAAIPAAAALTARLRIGSLVFGTTYRHPAVLANWAATTDHIAGGRLVLGVGAGWQVNEHAQYGIDLPPVRQRVDRFAECCEVITRLLREPSVGFEGRWFTLTDAVCEPKPVQARLPLLIGGRGDRMLGLVARWADEWNMWSTPSVLAERRHELHHRCDAIGRDPSAIRVSTQALVLLTDDRTRARELVDAVAPRPCVAGPPEEVAAFMADWVEAGVDEAIVPDVVLGRGTRRLDAMDAILAATTALRAGG